MPITLTVPDEISRAAEEKARASGTSAEDVLLKALQAYFLGIPAALQEELDAWDLASDHDMAEFERREGPA